MAERLGTGLQNLVQRFDSASHLKKKRAVKRRSSFFCLPIAFVTRTRTFSKKAKRIDFKFFSKFFKKYLQNKIFVVPLYSG